MISFKQFLEEDDDDNKNYANVDLEVTGSAEKTIAVLDEHAPHWRDIVASNSASLLFRGFGAGLPTNTATFRSTSQQRKSRDTNNVYQLLMDISPALDGFVSRSNALICATSVKISKVYLGTGAVPYVIFPPKNTPITVSGERDFVDIVPLSLSWKFTFFANQLSNMLARYTGTFRERYTSADQLEKDFLFVAAMAATPTIFMIILSNNIKIGSTPTSYSGQDDEIDTALSTLNSFPQNSQRFSKELLEKIETAVWRTNEISCDAGWKRYFRRIEDSPKSEWLKKLAEYVATPSSLKLQTINFGNEIPHGREIWFAGDYVAVPLPVFASILEAATHHKITATSHIKSQLNSIV